MSALTAEQIAATVTDAFDVAHRYFAAGARYDALTLADFQAAPPTGWTVSGDTITPPGGWTEITGRVTWAGEFTQQQQEQTETWQATLQGEAYDAALLGRELALAGFVRYRNLTTGWDSGWRCEWVGAVAGYQWSDGYRAGQPWQITVGGAETQIALSDGPRIVTGSINLAEGAELSPSSTLAVPAAEAGNGEFVGATANVDAANMLDGRLSTVWISADVPTITGEGAVAGHVVNEVFFAPIAGYAADGAWWVEIYNNAGDGSGIEVNRFLAYTADGKIAVVTLPQQVLYGGQSIIICRNRTLAEGYAGSFSQAAQVYETDVLGSTEFVEFYEVSDAAGHTGTAIRTSGEYCQFDMRPAGGWFFWWQEGGWLPGGAFRDAVKWGASVAGPGGSDHGQWTGAPVSVASLTPGQSLRRSPACQDTNAAGDWVAGIPSPGGYYTPNNSQWIRAELREHLSTLTQDVAAGANTLTFAEGTLGWPPAGEGVIDGDVFSYTARTGGGLTGVTGLLAHAAGSLAYPYVNGDAQTGWRATELRLDRIEGLPKIKRIRVWTSPYAERRTYNEGSFWVDYEEPFYTVENGTQMAGGLSEAGAVASVVVPFRPPRGDARWVRTILLTIDAMWGDGRAKINEYLVRGEDVAISGVFAPALGSTKAAALAAYLVDGYSWLAAADFEDATGDGWGLIGGVATAVAPLPAVLQDLARSHGCVVRYTPAGRIVFARDPWWPGGTGMDDPPAPLYAFNETNVRGRINFSGQARPITGVAVVARDPQGRALARQVYPPGASGSGVVEQQGLTVRDEKTAADLAFYLYLKLGSEARASLTVRGIGDWCAPGQRVWINWRQRRMGQWIIERVTRRWSWDRSPQGVAVRRFETALELRSYMGMP